MLKHWHFFVDYQLMSPRRKAGHRLHQQVLEERRRQRRAIGWRYIPGVAIYVGVASLVILFVATFAPAELVWAGSGFFVGASLLFLWVAADTPSASRLESAAFSEEVVSTELRKLKPLGWHVIDNLPFEHFDVDHVAIGPGGVIVFETKWSEEGWEGRLSTVRALVVAKADRQVARLAAPVNAVLKQNGSSATVRGAAIVACGARRPDETTRTAGGTRVVPVELIGDFVRGLSPVMEAAEVDLASEAVTTFMDCRLVAMAHS